MFTLRQREVLERLVEGEPQKAIAETLRIQERTVRFHLQNARRRAKAGSTLALAVFFVRDFQRQTTFRF